jgi:hypothetical protein
VSRGNGNSRSVRLEGGGVRRGVTMNLWYYLVSIRTVGHGKGNGRGRQPSHSGVHVHQLLLCKFLSFTSFDCHVKSTLLPNPKRNTRRNLVIHSWVPSVVRVPGYRSRGPALDSRHYQIF